MCENENTQNSSCPYRSQNKKGGNVSNRKAEAAAAINQEKAETFSHKTMPKSVQATPFI